jgi:FAD:protein FMN transferase
MKQTKEQIVDSCYREDTFLEKQLPLLGKEVGIKIYGVDASMAEFLFNDIYNEGRRLEKIFSFFDENSELSKLNRKRKMKVSKELLIVIKKALHYCELTDGKYDISLGKIIRSRKNGPENRREDIKKFHESKIDYSYKDIQADKHKISLMHKDVEIDLGSIAKGYIADQLVEFMKELGIEAGFVDARGDMKIFGKISEVIVIQHPRDSEKTIHPFILENHSVATSGDYNQCYGSFDKCHIVNKDGSADIISVTVAGESLSDADAIATCIFLLGTKAAEEFAKKIPLYKIFLIDRSLKEYMYNGFESLAEISEG